MTSPAQQNLDLSNLRNAFDSAATTLTFDHATLADAVKQCNELLTVLRDAHTYIGGLTFRTGFDSVASASQLAQGISNRTDHKDEGTLLQALDEHAKTVRALRDALVKSGHDYLTQEQINASSYHLPKLKTANDVHLPNTETDWMPKPPRSRGGGRTHAYQPHTD